VWRNIIVKEERDRLGIPEPKMNKAFRFIRINGRFFSAEAAPLDFQPPALIDSEQYENYVPLLFLQGRDIMVRAVAEEALALASISLFLAMVAVWAQVLGVV
jgi:hypothetical protein